MARATMAAGSAAKRNAVRRSDSKARKLLKNPKLLFAFALIVAESILVALIIAYVPYTKIDWDAYMSQVSGFLGGERDYENLKGDTGPLVYPAGFLYLYSAIQYVTGGQVFLAQILFGVLYILNLGITLVIYLKTDVVPWWALSLLSLSKRVHSIFVLRLFNDCLATTILHGAMLLLLYQKWHLGLIIFSAAVSVKMNVLLYAPPLLLLMMKAMPIDGVISALAGAALVQINVSQDRRTPPMARATMAAGSAAKRNAVRRSDSKARKLLKNPKLLFAFALIVAESILVALIIAYVPYTKIDWDAYMSQVSGFLGGERDYENLKGDTGPLVYPAGFLYLYSAIQYVTGGQVFLAQILFGVLYILNLGITLVIYLKTDVVPWWALSLLSLSKRVHSIFVLRLFNDCLATTILHGAMLLLLYQKWHLGLIIFSAAVSVKMNVLLYAPPLLLLMMKAMPIDGVISALAGAALVQINVSQDRRTPPMARATMAAGSAAKRNAVRRSDSKARKLLKNPKLLFAFALIVAESILVALIIAYVPYTKIDWDAYMSQVSGFLGGERDYENLKGDTGPLVYPAGFLYLYSAIQYVTGGQVFLAQILFGVLYILNLGITLVIYLKTDVVPWWALSLLSLSKRVHSIFVLRLFNDCLATTILHGAMLLLLYQKWHLGLIIFSAAVSVKMNVLLYAPPLLLLMMKAMPIDGVISALAGAALVQIVLGLPFILPHPVSYMSRAFNLGRVFIHFWSVNFKFVPEQLFVSKPFALSLLAAHLILLIVFAHFRWCRHEGGLFAFLQYKIVQLKHRIVTLFSLSRKSLSSQNLTHKRLQPDHIVTTMFVGNFIGILCARSLHYQFYSWYFYSIPYLLWKTSFPTFVRLLLFFAVELCWNVYPSNAYSSIVLLSAHLVILGGLWAASPEYPYADQTSDKSSTTKKGR